MSHKEYETYRKKLDKWTCFVCSERLDSSREDDAADSTGSSSDSDHSDEEHVASQSRRSLSKAKNIELSKNSPSNRNVIIVLMKRLDELETSIKFNNNLVDEVQKTQKKNIARK